MTETYSQEAVHYFNSHFGPEPDYPDRRGVNEILDEELVHCLERIAKRISDQCKPMAEDAFNYPLKDIARELSDVVWDSFAKPFKAEVRA